MAYTVYIHKNKINGKIYVGQTSKEPPEKRWRNGRGYENQFFFKAIQKYGWDNFEHIIIYTNLSSEEADEKEKELIQKYQSTDPSKGYNCTFGGKEKDKMSEASIQKIKDSWTEERRKEYSEKLKERWKNDTDFQEKSKKGVGGWKPIGELNPMYGSNRQGANAGNKKKVKCIETGDVFETIVDAAKWANEGSPSIKSHISQVCKGKRKTSGKHPITKEPLHWEYVEISYEVG